LYQRKYQLLDQVAEQALALAQSQWQRNLESSVLSELLASCREAFPELALAGLRRNRLVTGQADLVILQADETWLVVDFKTCGTSPGQTAENLVRQNGWSAQVLAYCDLMQDFGQVAGAVWLTEPCQLVYIQHAS
jgi:ATP-dependent exoDNAse (exonuclease V) beta subunit